MKDVINIGAIGWRNHAANVIDAVGLNAGARVACTYHPSYVPVVPGGTSSFDDLLKMDGVMILSPNDTHMHYLERLLALGFGGHILCEKPPVTGTVELKRLRELDPKRVMYDFSLRHSYLMTRLQQMVAQVGTIITANVWVTHGLAFKPGYPASWRADGSRHTHGVLETVSVHWIDAMLSLFGRHVRTSHHQRNIAGTGSAADTSVLHLGHDSGAQTTIVSSYATPAQTRVLIVGSDGVIEYDEGTLTLRTPRDTFDAAGKFMKPHIKEMDWAPDPFIEGTRAAISSFISACRWDSLFPDAWMQRSLETMDVIVECKGLVL